MDKEDIFRKLIQQAGPDKTSPDFTGMVMKNIQIEAEQALEREAVLETILVKLQPESPSPLFQKSIMAQIAMSEKKSEEPIISKKVWYLVAAMVLLVIGFFVVGQSDAAVQSTPDFFVKIDRELFKLQEGMMALPMIYPAVIFALSTLIMADYFVRQRVVRN